MFCLYLFFQCFEPLLLVGLELCELVEALLDRGVEDVCLETLDVDVLTGLDIDEGVRATPDLRVDFDEVPIPILRNFFSPFVSPPPESLELMICPSGAYRGVIVRVSIPRLRLLFCHCDAA